MRAASHEPSYRKGDRARNLAVGRMVCPGCAATLTVPVDECARCGFSGHTAVANFPYAAPALDRCIDPKHHLTDGTLLKIAESSGDLEERFPQVRISTCLIDLVPEANLREFGFWLMNASSIRDQSEAENRPWTILLVIDDANGRASVTSGYAIEPFLEEGDLESLLRSESRHFIAKDYGSVILRFIDGVLEILDARALQIDRRRERR